MVACGAGASRLGALTAIRVYVTPVWKPCGHDRHRSRAAASGSLTDRWEQRVNSIAWTAVVVAGWFVLNLMGTIVNQPGNTVGRFIWLQQSGDVPVQSSGTTPSSRLRTGTRTSGKLVVYQPKWLEAPARALNNMRAQAPYLAAMMALAWWIERMYFG